MQSSNDLLINPPAKSKTLSASAASSRKPFLSRLNESNRVLGIFFGCLGGMVLGVVLVSEHEVSIAIIGVPSSTALQVITVLLAMGTGGNLCSYIGACLDVITGERTIFDGCAAAYRWLRGRPEGGGEGEAGKERNS